MCSLGVSLKPGIGNPEIGNSSGNAKIENGTYAQGRIWDLLRGGAYPEIVSLKQGVWGAQPPRSYRVFYFA